VRDNETGLLVAPRDEAGLSRAILRVLEDGLLKERLQNAAGREVREHFTAARMAAATLNVYREAA
jgi:glycosyltransferase involved in cell wall biosynthesis